MQITPITGLPSLWVDPESCNPESWRQQHPPPACTGGKQSEPVASFLHWKELRKPLPFEQLSTISSNLSDFLLWKRLLAGPTTQQCWAGKEEGLLQRVHLQPSPHTHTDYPVPTPELILPKTFEMNSAADWAAWGLEIFPFCLGTNKYSWAWRSHSVPSISTRMLPNPSWHLPPCTALGVCRSTSQTPFSFGHAAGQFLSSEQTSSPLTRSEGGGSSPPSSTPQAQALSLSLPQALHHQ